jgi:hypothetical protein
MLRRNPFVANPKEYRMPKLLASLIVPLLAATAFAADGSRTEVIQLDVKPTVISPALAPAAAPAPEVRAVAKPKANAKKSVRKQIHKKGSPGKPAKKSPRAKK